MISPRGTSTYGGSTSSPVATSLPSGVQAGDYLVLPVSSDTSLLSAPAGWSSFNQLRISSPDGGELAVFHKRAVNSEPAANYTSGTPEYGSSWVLAAYSGVDLTTAMDADATNATSSASNTGTIVVTAPSITTITDGARLVWMLSIDSADGGEATVTPPTGFTLVNGFKQDYSQIYVADATQSVKGASGAKSGSFTVPSGAAGWMVYLMALRPAVAGAVGRIKRLPPQMSGGMRSLCGGMS